MGIRGKGLRRKTAKKQAARGSEGTVHQRDRKNKGFGQEGGDVIRSLNEGL